MFQNIYRAPRYFYEKPKSEENFWDVCIFLSGPNCPNVTSFMISSIKLLNQGEKYYKWVILIQFLRLSFILEENSIKATKTRWLILHRANLRLDE